MYPSCPSPFLSSQTYGRTSANDAQFGRVLYLVLLESVVGLQLEGQRRWLAFLRPIHKSDVFMGLSSADCVVLGVDFNCSVDTLCRALVLDLPERGWSRSPPLLRVQPYDLRRPKPRRHPGTRHSQCLRHDSTICRDPDHDAL